MAAGTKKKAAGVGSKAKEEEMKQESDDEDDEVLMGTVKVQEKGKKKVHQFKLDKDKISQPVCIKYYEPLDLVAFALVNRQLKFFTLRQTVSKLVFEQQASIRTD